VKAKKYLLGSQEGVDFASVRLRAEPQSLKVGDEVSLELDDDRQEQALLAAAWLKDPKEKEG
jgi:hypothetical protein